MILGGPLATLRRVIALFALIVLDALADDLRPDTGFTPGAPVEVDPIPPSGSTSAPLFTFPVGGRGEPYEDAPGRSRHGDHAQCM
ncbi:hypothetical protein SAMN04488074_11920 [Lentzea albidocapillata subsp. violacea]|uniref:Uncharacterized protein n=1 Tax=Lentzea albidocapillata subsp. violacea TaxID=128104 RepID=A0A1G9RU88_9PSEU|nr:hypothetical protein SAMN04488074_11920 [Lentzea albidocapillata subsp. violacea]